MTILRIIALIFITFASSRTYLRFRDRSLSISNFILWMIIWIFAIIFIFDPALSDIIAKVAGLGRGVDAAFLLAIMLLFYLTFRIYIKIDAIDKNLTSLTINLSKKFHKEKQDEKME